MRILILIILGMMASGCAHNGTNPDWARGFYNFGKSLERNANTPRASLISNPGRNRTSTCVSKRSHFSGRTTTTCSSY
jgi:hypothetical protein